MAENKCFERGIYFWFSKFFGPCVNKALNP